MAEVQVNATHYSDGEIKTDELKIDSKGFSVIVHDQNIGVDVPSFVEVSPEATLACIAEMTQGQWRWISTGVPFRTLWDMAFDPQDLQPPPEDVEVLKQLNAGIRHVAGMIVLSFEALSKGKNIFVKEQETHLHPRTERCIMTMFHELMRWFGVPNDSSHLLEEVSETHGPPPPPDPKDDVAATLDWLQSLKEHYGPDHEFGTIAHTGERITLADMENHVLKDTENGRQIVAQFVYLRDGKPDGKPA